MGVEDDPGGAVPCGGALAVGCEDDAEIREVIEADVRRALEEGEDGVPGVEVAVDGVEGDEVNALIGGGKGEDERIGLGDGQGGGACGGADGAVNGRDEEAMLCGGAEEVEASVESVVDEGDSVGEEKGLAGEGDGLSGGEEAGRLELGECAAVEEDVDIRAGFGVELECGGAVEGGGRIVLEAPGILGGEGCGVELFGELGAPV